MTIDKWFRVVRVVGQGYGTLAPEQWDVMPEIYRERMHVLELVSDQRSATATYERLITNGDSEWRDKPGLHKAHGQWWEDAGTVVDGVRLQVPADMSLPVVEVKIPAILCVLADILEQLPPDRSRAEIRALDWYWKNLAL